MPGSGARGRCVGCFQPQEAVLSLPWPWAWLPLPFNPGCWISGIMVGLPVPPAKCFSVLGMALIPAHSTSSHGVCDSGFIVVLGNYTVRQGCWPKAIGGDWQQWILCLLRLAWTGRFGWGATLHSWGFF